MDIFDSYATNLEAEEKGRWFENGNAEFLIARSGNRAYSEGIQAQFTAHKHTLDQKDTPEARQAGNDRAEKIQVLVMSRSVLLGWRGSVTYKGVDLEFSQANAAKLLAHKDFRNWVNGKSDDFRNYLESVKKDDEKNSATTSTGT